MIIECIHKHPKQGTHDFNKNLPLIDKFSRERKNIQVMGDFNVLTKTTTIIKTPLLF